MRNLFRLKSNNPHPTWATYEKVFTCNENYIGKTERNVNIKKLL